MAFRQATLTKRMALDGRLADSESKQGVSGGSVQLDPAAPVSTVHAVGASLNTFTLGDGIVVGQRKQVVLGTKAGTGNARIVPSLMSGAANITLDTAGESVALVWTQTGWALAANTGGAVA